MNTTSPHNVTEGTESQPARKHRPLWLRIIKWLGIGIAAIAVLVIAVISIAVWYLTPQKLTPMVNRAASEYLLADVDAKRVELTFWHTFPRLEVTVDSLAIVSRSLREIPDSIRVTLPADADTLLTVNRFSGGINVGELTLGNIALYDVIIDRPRLNLVVASDSIDNFSIIPPSDTTSTGGSTVIPPLSINRFAITGNFPTRFCAPSDSIDFTLMLRDSQMLGHEAPLYSLSISGDAGGNIHPVLLSTLPFGLDGKVKWSQANPSEIGLENMKVTLGKLQAGFNAGFNFENDPLIHTLTVDIDRMRLADLLEIIPDNYKKGFEGLDTDLSMKLGLRLDKHYRPLTDSIPSVSIDVKADAERLRMGQLYLTRLSLDGSAVIAGDSLDASTIDIRRLKASGRSVDVDLSTTVARPLSNPRLKGRFEGNVNLGSLPASLMDKLPARMTGMLRGETDFNFAVADLTPKRFHRVILNGMLALTDFNLSTPDSTVTAYTARTVFRLGSSSRIKYQGVKIDSLLTASLTVDTARISGYGAMAAGRDMKIGFATRNVASTLDTSSVTPLGVTISAALLTATDDSTSTRMLLRDTAVKGAIQRFQSNDKAPLIKALVNARTALYADRYNRALLADGHADLTLHPRVRRAANRPRRSTAARADSSAAVSVSANRLHVNDTTASLLRRWTASGNMKARTVRIFTPAFPLRTRVDSMNLDFNTDSVILHPTDLTAGKSSLRIYGTIRNIRGALTGRRRPLDINLNASSRHLDVNELTDAALRGAAFITKVEDGTAGRVALTDDAASLQKSIESQTAEDDRGAFVIPGNITANVRLLADEVVYSDVILNRLTGNLSVYDGALRLDRLAARSPIGNVNFSALLSAPDASDLSFAAGMNVRRMDLNHVMRMIPNLDSIMPMLKDLEGIVNADMALTTSLDSAMNLRLNTLEMALKLSGDSLVLLDSETFATLSKWLMFKNKKRNMIDHMDVEMTVKDSRLNLYPFIFDMDRYKFGVRGGNDMGLNLDYHVSVLKSPLPFKFGINIKGTPDDMKIRVGKARINEKTVASSTSISDTVRVNLVKEIGNMFRRGARRGRAQLRLTNPVSAAGPAHPESSDTISHADSVMLIKEGVLSRPAGFVMPGEEADQPQAKKKK
ncbi:MAG: hypothetical protein K1V81_05180 [Paramuribaculum sp.]|jgi:hypothetical protein